MFDPNAHMMKLKGKDYLQVAWRLVWFRDAHPDWMLSTTILEQDAEHAIMKCTISDETGVLRSTGHGSESKRDFGDYLEKAETKAVGRALAMLGYGTQFAADELDEGERIVDSPLDLTPSNAPPADNPIGAPTFASKPQRELIKSKLTPVNLKRAQKMYGEDLERMPANVAGETLQALKAVPA